MKLTGILMLIALLHVSAAGLSQKVSLSLKDASLEKVFDQIKQQTGLSFLWDEQLLVNTRPVTLNVKDANVADVLDQCLKNQGLSYSVIQNMVVIKKITGYPAITEPSPPIDIHGHVTDSLGNPLAGASITVKGNKKGTSTDVNGDFILRNVGNNSILVISFTGYKSKQIKIADANPVSVFLTKSNDPLDEVQIIAYGTTTRRLNTGDVSTITSKTISEQPVSNTLAALEGRVTGLDITQNTGLASGNFTTRIRGQNSIANGNEPLYIIDGVPFTSTSIASYLGTSVGLGGGSPLSSFSPSDIESVEVLKDADATAIYGSRGANGVILITTKKGTQGQTRANFNIYTGAGQVPHMIPLLNTSEYLAMRNEAFKNDGATPDPNSDYDLTAWDTTRYTNWEKMFIGGTSKITDAQLSISGGNKNTQFLVGGGFRNETTVFPGDFGNKKINTHFNILNTSPNGKFQISISGGYSTENNNLPQTDLTNESITLPPDAPPLYDSAGNLNWANNTFLNPYGQLMQQKFSNSTRNLIGSANLQYQIIQGLYLKAALGYTSLDLGEIEKIPVSSEPPSYGVTTGYTLFSTNSLNTSSIEPQVEYKLNTGPGKLDILLGTTFQQTKTIGQLLFGSGYVSDALIGDIAGASTLSLWSSTNTLYKYNAFFGRINYNWKDKYILNLTARRDGSSRFGPGNQFGNFGAIGGAWIFTEEPFMKGRNSFLNFGKLRMSYGTTGNDQISDYQYLSTYSTTTYPYQGNLGLQPARLYNPDFAWEINRKFEAGLELTFFRERLQFSVSYYQNRSSNQLVGYPLPQITGFGSIQANLNALVQNTGWEFHINSTNIRHTHFEWTSSFNLSIPNNVLLNFPNIAGTSYSNTYAVGKSLYVQMSFPSAGVNQQTGLYQFLDTKNTLTSNPSYPADLQPVKTLSKTFYGGLNNNFQFDGFEISFFIQFVKQTGYSYFYGGNQLSAPGMFGNQPTYVLDRWQKPGDITNTQQFSQSYGSAYTAYSDAGLFGSDRIVDASFIRLKNLYISYQLPGSLVQKIHFQNWKVYLQGQNLLTITSYQGLDPETQLLTSLPILRVVAAGIQLNF